MKLIAQIDSIVTTSKTGGVRKRKQGLFECPICKNHVKKEYSNGLKSDTCGKGCKDNGCIKHNQSGTKLYVCWNNIRLRCDNPNHCSYLSYGGKGITYPDKWKTFEGFFEDMGAHYKEGLTIDRRDPTKNYCKENCQWITRKENSTKDAVKAVKQLDLDGNFICSYGSTVAAGKATGLRKESIARAARGERPYYNKYKWEYI